MEKEELVFHKDDKGNIMSGGYKINSNTFKDVTLSIPVGLYYEKESNIFDRFLKHEKSKSKRKNKTRNKNKSKNKKTRRKIK